MRNILPLLLISLFIIPSISNAQQTLEKEEWAKFFNDSNINGCLVLYDTKTQQFQYYNEKRCDSTYLPAFTFKILNSLIALETKAVNGIYDSIKWDGKDRGWPLWNQDQCMNSALGISCFWFYQELVRRMGEGKMQEYIDKAQYGNQIIGPILTTFGYKVISESQPMHKSVS
ncbi:MULTISPECIES: penicillin-binding transpeptidase domain-containing protein [unclassified Lentimicrobium]|uniref:penicillin-binding transpeptidase domain-containing protein n=1 Tax=unclassified Lentimicrobium TaxID=2677434 RepID=UPI001551ADD9|nr:MULTISPECIES: penicillin-binding transpeptidase domain-containing protein [unclassified Lentimicrobium]NPD47786.1 hypothetical protein [Lentimicrobium sp. S6]NPD86721.1 hypothetical protein [Lentimicrobium sp. L6]